MRSSIKNDKYVLNLILQNLDKSVVIILNENNELKVEDDMIEVWAVYNSLEKAYPIMPKLYKTDMMYLMDLCISSKLGLKLNGIVDNTEFIFDFNELLNKKDIIFTTKNIFKYLNKEINKKTLIDNIKDSDVYFIGSLPTSNNNENIGVKTLKAVDDTKDMIPVFLNKEDSNKFNLENTQVTKTKLKNIIKFYNNFNVILEPGKKHWVLLHI